MRYLPQSNQARKEMLDTIGVSSVDELFKDVPKSAFVEGKVNIPDHKGELQVERELSAHANENHAAINGPFFLGAGCYFHHVPATVDYIIQRSEFLTAYTPYQPEIAQGSLQALFEFQSMIAQITGQEVANASLYDGATAMTEAALMAMRVTKRKKIVLGNDIHPHYTQVLNSYVKNYRGEVSVSDGEVDNETACVIIQSPDFYGTPHKYDALRAKCDETGALLVVVINEIISLGLLPAPTEADIVCGEAQSIGLPMSFGGPHLGFFACRQKFVRQMPGRLCGMTEDADGKRGFVLTLNTREQHIRRDKATSNICTNQGLCALAFTVHMTLLGEDGFKNLAKLNHAKACALADALEDLDGLTQVNKTFFNEVTFKTSKKAGEIIEALAAKNIIAGFAPDDEHIVMAATEMTTDYDISSLKSALKEVL